LSSKKHIIIFSKNTIRTSSTNQPTNQPTNNNNNKQI
jgi:hypothetical protein